jgi:hypothetical protein
MNDPSDSQSIFRKQRKHNLAVQCSAASLLTLPHDVNPDDVFQENTILETRWVFTQLALSQNRVFSFKAKWRTVSKDFINSCNPSATYTPSEPRYL